MALLPQRIWLSLNCASRVLRWVDASRVYPTCAHMSADLGQARDRCLFSLAQERSLQSPGTRDRRVPDKRALASEDPGPRGHTPAPKGHTATRWRTQLSPSL